MLPAMPITTGEATAAYLVIILDIIMGSICKISFLFVNALPRPPH